MRTTGQQHLWASRFLLQVGKNKVLQALDVRSILKNGTITTFYALAVAPQDTSLSF
jgi:hypothetical protein